MVKLIRSLEQKKYRKRHNMFVAEGHKAVGDMMKRIAPYKILATDEWVCPVAQTRANIVRISEEELSKVSFLQHPQQVIGLFPIPEEKGTGALDPENKLTLALDGVQDPGNLGTIIRLADWFGIEDVFCSPQTADIYNPKAMQATMGGIAHVRIHYTPLPDLIRNLETDIPIYGTFLDGENMYGEKLSKNGLIVMGNEGNGISPEVGCLINRRLYIPNYPTGRETSESLNVAIATAVVCAEFRRQAPSL